MNVKVIDRLTAGFVFAWALVLYLLTMAPTASFWDAGEFIAIANQLQVSHPPGAPFYMLVGRFFSMFVPTAYIALSVNLVSVLASALTVLLTHLIIVRLVREWQGSPSTWSGMDRLAALGGGVIGALTFAATDSFWFNAVEAEVYAMSMFFTAAVVWLIMKWSEQAIEEEAALAGGQHPFGLRANRYLVLIAYLFGLAIGIHLLNLLAIFFIALIFFFTEIEQDDWDRQKRWLGILVTGVVASGVFLVIYPGIIQMLPDLVGKFGAPILLVLLFIGLVVFGVYYTHKQGMQVANLAMLCLAVVLIGYSTYALIFIRSAADPPIDENDPETVEAIVSYLKREQYGATPLLKGNAYSNSLGRIDYQREALFPRRWSPDPNHGRIYSQYDSDFEFFREYQLGHMYLRYFMWNFVGKASDVQDAPPITGISFVDDGITGADDAVAQTPSEAASRNAYFALPLLLGLLGAGYHFHRDWRRGFSVLILFLVTGIGIILYLNQTPMQPRERDYSYVASFFAFSLWVGIGASGVLQLIRDALTPKDGDAAASTATGIVGAVALILFLAVPAWMTAENYDDHDRSGQYVAPEYAYNMLMSLDENAILFTNGDNDTFPLWYLQEVEGVRTDVRVVNLSLLNTPWYVRQLKHQASRESAPLPISLSDEQINTLSIMRWEARDVSLPVNRDQLMQRSEMDLAVGDDTSQIENPMSWRLTGRPFDNQSNLLYAADQVAYDILRTNAEQGWERPIYFAVTVSPDGQLDLQEYFQLEGQAQRVVPIKHQEPLGRIVPGLTDERMKQFRFTGLDDPDVYFDENIRRMVDNYRNVFSHTAQELAEQGHTARAISLLDTLLTQVPFETIPGDEQSFLLMARAYEAAGDSERVVSLLQRAEPLVLLRLTRVRTSQDLNFAARYVNMIRLAYLDSGAFDAAAAFTDRLAAVLGDSTYRQSADELRREYQSQTSMPPAQGPPGS